MNVNTITPPPSFVQPSNIFSLSVNAVVENYVDEFNNLHYLTDNDKDLCGYSVRYKQ